MTPPPHPPIRPRRRFRRRVRYLILAILTLPILFGGGILILLILLGSHTTETSETPHHAPTSAVSGTTTPSPIPSPHACYPFQPSC
ncbi:hypothetical protein [Nocardia heshunensis]